MFCLFNQFNLLQVLQDFSLIFLYLVFFKWFWDIWRYWGTLGWSTWSIRKRKWSCKHLFTSFYKNDHIFAQLYIYGEDYSHNILISQEHKVQIKISTPNSGKFKSQSCSLELEDCTCNNMFVGRFIYIVIGCNIFSGGQFVNWFSTTLNITCPEIVICSWHNCGFW